MDAPREDISTNGDGHNHNHHDDDDNHLFKKQKLSFISESEIRQEFAHHQPGIARINNGSFGCCPSSIVAAQKRWQLRFLQQPDDFFFNHLQKRILHSRNLIKTLINADHVDEVSLVDNATTAAAIVLQHVGWAFAEGRFQKGDAVVMLHCAFQAVKKSIEAYVTRAGGSVIVVQLPFPVSSNEEIIAEFRRGLARGKAKGRKIRLAIIDHITSMPAVVIPVRELVKICREEGVEQVFVDAAHAIGNVHALISYILIKNIQPRSYILETPQEMIMEIEEVKSFQQPLPLLSLNHVSLLVKDVWDSVRFYEDVLGFCSVKRPSSLNFRGAWLYNYGIGIHLLENESLQDCDTVNEPRPINPKDNHISFQCTDVVVVRKRLEEMGMRYVTAVVEEDGITVDQVFFHDPDGYMIEICNCENIPMRPVASVSCPFKNPNFKKMEARHPRAAAAGGGANTGFDGPCRRFMETTLMMESLSMDMLNFSF